MRAISPGCGVRTRGPGRADQHVEVARRARSGRRRRRPWDAAASATSSRASACASGSQREARAQRDRVDGGGELADGPERAPRARARPRQSPASASVMCSTPSVATMGCCEAGVATVTSPAPLRSAARAASAAAPGLAERAGDHEQMAETALVGVRGAPREALRASGILRGGTWPRPARDLAGRACRSAPPRPRPPGRRPAAAGARACSRRRSR